MDRGCCMSVKVSLCVCFCLCQLYNLNGSADFDDISHSLGDIDQWLFSQILDIICFNLMTWVGDVGGEGLVTEKGRYEGDWENDWNLNYSLIYKAEDDLAVFLFVCLFVCMFANCSKNDECRGGPKLQSLFEIYWHNWQGLSLLIFLKICWHYWQPVHRVQWLVFKTEWLSLEHGTKGAE